MPVSRLVLPRPNSLASKMPASKVILIVCGVLTCLTIIAAAIFIGFYFSKSHTGKIFEFIL